MTPRPSQRSTIIDAALACFARNGYDATRIRDIAEAAGVSEGALYRHFTSKEDLARELHVQAMATFSEELQDAADAPTSTESLRKMAARVLTLYREQPAAFVYALVQAPPAAVASMPDHHELPIDIIASVIERARVEGGTRAGDSRVLAACYLGCLMQPIMLSLSAPGCVLDVLADDTQDATMVDAALGTLGLA
ncbi:MAG: TetR/AcrR family transcriptional regulator [Coriobacteriia bacterium]|nr:TetR/AcrR family transcriptional regulator [Coriobacteriia bacterium]MBN2847325.1 TetR/AcrR family transcriptional regulator [Coriobacteriia bacterium]